MQETKNHGNKAATDILRTVGEGLSGVVQAIRPGKTATERGARQDFGAREKAVR